MLRLILIFTNNTLAYNKNVIFENFYWSKTILFTNRQIKTKKISNISNILITHKNARIFLKLYCLENAIIHN